MATTTALPKNSGIVIDEAEHAFVRSVMPASIVLNAKVHTTGWDTFAIQRCCAKMIAAVRVSAISTMEHVHAYRTELAQHVI